MRLFIYLLLVASLQHFLFSPKVGMMIQSDFHIFPRGGSTTNQIILAQHDPKGSSSWVKSSYTI